MTSKTWYIYSRLDLVGMETKQPGAGIPLDLRFDHSYVPVIRYFIRSQSDYYLRGHWLIAWFVSAIYIVYGIIALNGSSPSPTTPQP